jgi:hypothetical protein
MIAVDLVFICERKIDAIQPACGWFDKAREALPLIQFLDFTATCSMLNIHTISIRTLGF